MHANLNLSKPRLMAILNATPDSFSDGGDLYSNHKIDRGKVSQRLHQIAQEGADLVDIGGESTRPGAQALSVQEELDRVIPIIELAVTETNLAVSVDTSSPEVISQAASSGAHLINDVRALTREGALAAAAETQLPVCLMHMQGTPQTMQAQPEYSGVVTEVCAYLQNRVTACLDAGMASSNLWLDPGIGFGKTLEHNLALLRHLPELCSLGFPVLVGVSRKSMIGHLLEREIEQRLPASLAFAMMSLERGAKVLRVHDVWQTRDIIDTYMAIETQ